MIFIIIIIKTVNLVWQLDVFYYHSQMSINEQTVIISCLYQKDLTVLIEIIILSNDINIVNVDTIIHWLDIYLLSDLVQQSRHADHQKERVYLMLLLNSESQSVILSDESDNSKMLKLYVNNSQCMLKILFKHLNDDMKLLNCDLFWFCIFCKSEIFKLVNN